MREVFPCCYIVDGLFCVFYLAKMWQTKLVQKLGLLTGISQPVCMVITYNRVLINRVWLPILLVVS